MHARKQQRTFWIVPCIEVMMFSQYKICSLSLHRILPDISHISHCCVIWKIPDFFSKNTVQTTLKVALNLKWLGKQNQTWWMFDKTSYLQFIIDMTGVNSMYRKFLERKAKHSDLKHQNEDKNNQKWGDQLGVQLRPSSGEWRDVQCAVPEQAGGQSGVTALQVTRRLSVLFTSRLLWAVSGAPSCPLHTGTNFLLHQLTVKLCWGANLECI